MRASSTLIIGVAALGAIAGSVFRLGVFEIVIVAVVLHFAFKLFLEPQVKQSQPAS